MFEYMLIRSVRQQISEDLTLSTQCPTIVRHAAFPNTHSTKDWTDGSDFPHKSCYKSTPS